MEEGSWPTNPKQKIARTARLHTVAHRIKELDEKKARDKENNTVDPKLEMDLNNPMLYNPCERDPPWQWSRKRPDNTYLRKEFVLQNAPNRAANIEIRRIYI